MPKDFASLEKRHSLASLQDLYKRLLPPRQREVLSLRLDEDMSWGEMALELGTTRQACEDAFKRGSKTLERYEEILGLCDLLGTQNSVIELLKVMDRDNWDDIRREILSLLKSWEEV